MSANDATMLSKDRDRHHDECRSDGFEWCPECGTLLTWQLAKTQPPPHLVEAWTPTMGDYPPLSAHQLV